MEGLENPYQAALRKTLKFLDYYDTDGFVPYFGFGAKMPPFCNSVSHCFAVNGNIFQPEIRGIHNMMRSYMKTLESVSFHGPSAMAPIIQFCIELVGQRKVSQDDQFYFILVMFSNGKISDMDATTDAFVELSYLPISVVLIGIGHPLPRPGAQPGTSTAENDQYEKPFDFKNLEYFDSDK